MGPQGPQGPSGVIGFDTNQTLDWGPGANTIPGFLTFVGPLNAITLQAGQRAFMTVTNSMGVGPAGGSLALVPCYRATNAPAGTAATMVGFSTPAVVAPPNSQLMYSTNYVFRPGVFNVPANQAIWIGMCALGAAANANWSVQVSGAITTLIFQ